MMTDLSDRQGVAAALLAQAQVHSMEGRHAKASSVKQKALALGNSKEISKEVPLAVQAATLEALGPVPWEECIHFYFTGERQSESP